ncbi:MAG TPA: hypothetical protein VIF57_19020 [Polyangia bacterium]|jgi:hypothetical protein
MRNKTMAVLEALAMAALLAGCGGSVGERRARLSPTEGVVIPDGGTDAAVLPKFKCSGSVAPFDCSMPFALHPDGHVTDFSAREWDNNSGKWCDESGFHGSLYSYTNSASFPQDTHTQKVDTDGALHMAFMVTGGQYGGGGLAFEGGCLDVSAFTGVQFTVAVVSGSLASCPLQLQLQTFDARPTTQTPPGGCDQNTTSCYSFPAATSLPAISTDPANPTLVQLPFPSFSKIAGELTQIVGLQWQVNAQAACTVEIKIDDVAFIPAAAPPEPGDSDGGTAQD